MNVSSMYSRLIVPVEMRRLILKVNLRTSMASMGRPYILLILTLLLRNQRF